MTIARYVGATKDFKGATGSITFDANGDTSSHLIGVYKIVGSTLKTAHWTFVALAPQK